MLQANNWHQLYLSDCSKLVVQMKISVFNNKIQYIC